jgi:hypothetical protein
MAVIAATGVGITGLTAKAAGSSSRTRGGSKLLDITACARAFAAIWAYRIDRIDHLSGAA